MNDFSGSKLDFSTGRGFRFKASWLFSVGLLIGLLLGSVAGSSVYAASPVPSVAGSNEVAVAANSGPVALSSSAAITTTKVAPPKPHAPIEEIIPKTKQSAAVAPSKVQPRLGPGCTVNGAGGANYLTISGAAGDMGCSTITVASGVYTENVIITHTLTLLGAGQASTIIIPAVSNPNCGGSGGGSLCSGASNIILVQADGVIIHDIGLDGDNPTLTSGIGVGAADIDARNGIITNHLAGTYNGLQVYNVTIKNIYLRGIYASSGGTFNIHDNNVSNVQANPSSIAIFNFGGGGTFSNNTVSAAADAISSNHSNGTQFLNNTITNSGSGVHTDNAGDNGGSADLIQGNTVSNCTANGYGVWVFVPNIAPTFNANTVTNCAVGFAAFGQGAPVTTIVSNNKITGAKEANGAGVYVTTDQLGFGFQNSSASFTSNTILNNVNGFLIDNSNGATATATSNFNRIVGNTTGFNNTTTTVQDATNNWWGCNAGPGAAGCDTVSNNVTFNPWLTLSLSASPTSVATNQNSALTAKTTINSAGTDTSASGHILDGTPITFSTNLGTVNPTGMGTTNGVANSSFSSPTNGTATVSTTLDNQTVNTNIQVAGPGCTVNSGGGADYITITAAITNINCATITVTGGGPYREFVVINRALTLNGPNAGINPNTNTRNPEAILYLPDGVSDPLNEDTQNNGGTSSSAGVIVRVLTNTVTIDGFTIDGANLTTGSGGSPVPGVMVNGVNINASTGIDNYTTAPATPQTVGNIQVQNNIIKNITREGVLFEENNNPTTSNYIRNNRFDNVFSGDNNNGFSVRVGFNFYSEISGNVITNGRHGIMVENTFSTNPGTTALIDNNTISVARRAIWYNNNYGSSSYIISNNVINGTQVTGLYFTTFFGNAQVAVSNNVITGGTSGIEAWNVYSTNPLTVNGGSVTGATYGAFLYNTSIFGPANSASQLVLSNVTLSNSGTSGVFVNDTNTTTLTLRLSGVTISGGPTGVLLNGPNTFFNLGDTHFVGQSGDYITLQTVASPNTPNDVNGRNAFYNGVSGINLTPATYDAIERKITDKLDDPTAHLGLVIFDLPNGINVLAVSQNQLNFKLNSGATKPVSQEVLLSSGAQTANWTTAISYGAGANGWLALNPTSGNILAGNAAHIGFTANPAGLVAGTYSAMVTFKDATNPNNTVTVNVGLNIGGANVNAYTYYLPFVANNVNGFTSQVTVQNTGNAAATVSAQYYDATGSQVSVSGTACSNIVSNAACQAPNPFASGTKGTGVIISNQPLAVIVQESTPFGGSAYAVNAGTSASLVAPLAINNNGGFVTQLTVANAGANATNVTVTFYDQNGNALPAATKTLNIGAHASQTLDQTAQDSGLPTGFYGWAQISGASGAQLVAQVLEQRADIKFVALANAQQLTANKVYAPAIFKGAFGGFVTGANIVNPNNNPLQVAITYYDNTGKVWAATPFTLAAHAVAPVYQGSDSGNGIPNGGLPAGFYGSATVSSAGGNLVMVVNEAGRQTQSGAAQSGTYAALSVDGAVSNSNIGLPIVANNGKGFTSGATVLNTGETVVNGSVSYYKPDGTQVGQTYSFTIAAHASLPVYQGDAGLPSGFYGQAVVSSSGGSLLVTTNAVSDNLFFTYTSY